MRKVTNPLHRKTLGGLRDALVLLLLLYTGLRVSALAGISVGDIDLRQRRIWVVEKGAKQR